MENYYKYYQVWFCRDGRIIKDKDKYKARNLNHAVVLAYVQNITQDLFLRYRGTFKKCTNFDVDLKSMRFKMFVDDIHCVIEYHQIYKIQSYTVNQFKEFKRHDKNKVLRLFF